MEVRFIMFPFSDDGMVVQNEVNGCEYESIAELKADVEKRGLHIKESYTATEYATGCNIGAFYSKNWIAAVTIKNPNHTVNIKS